MKDGYLYKAKTTPKEKGEFNNVWVIGNLIVSNGRYYIHPINNIVNVENEIGRIIVMHEVIPDTICKCAGLKDKNDKLIWENDIVSFAHENYTRNYAIEFKNTFHNYGLRFRNKSIHFRCTQVTLCMHDCEVIGNIFDSPELLESEEQHGRE